MATFAFGQMLAKILRRKLMCSKSQILIPAVNHHSTTNTRRNSMFKSLASRSHL